MHMPDVHNCSQLNEENAVLRKKVRRLKQQNMELQRDLNDLKDKQRMEAMKREFISTRNMEVQTDPMKASNICKHTQLQKKTPLPPAPPPPAPESERVSKLLSMHNSLMRRYEKELKTNMHHMDSITNLNLKVNEMEQKFREGQMKNQRLEKERAEALQLMTAPNEDITRITVELRKVKKERDQLVGDIDKIKKELGGLDFGFFEEVEDLKYALEQSTRLNHEYERSLRRMCLQFGVPYPHPEKQLAAKAQPGPSTSYGY